jgi:hypothetical protein
MKNRLVINESTRIEAKKDVLMERYSLDKKG